MNVAHINITCLLNSIKRLFCTNCLQELTMNTVNYIASVMGLIIRYPKEIFMKRLQRRKRKIFADCTQKMKGGGCKCCCRRCTSHRTTQRKRVIEPDFFANLAYQHRVSKSKEISRVTDAQIIKPCCGDESDQVTRCKKPSDHRDVPSAAPTGWTWWTNVSCQQYMPPMYHPCRVPTKSECSSSISGYRSATPNAESLKSLNESLKSRRNGSAASIVTTNRSVVEIAVIKRKTQNRSKSDSRVVLRSDRKLCANCTITGTGTITGYTKLRNKIKRLTRSVSAKAPSLKKKKRSRRLFNVRRKRSKAKPERKVTSRASLNNFSTLACCSQTGTKLK